MFFPFFFQALSYTWVAVYDPGAEVRASILRWGNFSIVFPIAAYYIMDNWQNIANWLKKKWPR